MWWNFYLVLDFFSLHSDVSVHFGVHFFHTGHKSSDLGNCFGGVGFDVVQTWCENIIQVEDLM